MTFKAFGMVCNKIYWKFFSDYDNAIANFFYNNRLSIKICKKCMQLTRDSYKKVNLYDVSKKWKSIFFDVCYHIGINCKSATLLWDEMCVHNNWDHLHPTEKEKNETKEELYNDFIDDVFYCSDRWGFDRLMRCQWKFRYWISNE